MEIYRNHQLYLAERQIWMDRHLSKTSQRAMMKIESWNKYDDYEEQYNKELLWKLVSDSFFNVIPNNTVLTKEGYFLSNLKN